MRTASVELVTQVVAAVVEAETSASALCPTAVAASFRRSAAWAEQPGEQWGCDLKTNPAWFDGENFFVMLFVLIYFSWLMWSRAY